MRSSVATPFRMCISSKADAEGVHHPHMMIASYGVPEGMTHLWDVPRPPGDGTPGTQYPEQTVTRNASSVGYLVKIAMKDYGIVETLTENGMVKDLGSDEGATEATHQLHESLSDGNRSGRRRCLSVSQQHLVTGSGGRRDCQYRPALRTRPCQPLPRRWFQRDTVRLQSLQCHRLCITHSPTDRFTRLRWGSRLRKVSRGDTTSDGVDEPLDDWSGHTHGAYGYHYHTVVETRV